MELKVDPVSIGLTQVKIKSTSTLQFPEQILNTAPLHRLEEFRLLHEMMSFWMEKSFNVVALKQKAYS